MSKLIRAVLYLILGLVLVIWLTLGLFRPEYLKDPIANWFLRQTGEPLTIGRLDYNPFYPNILLAEQIKWGDRFSAEKIYIEIAHGSWKNPSLEIAHLDIIRPRLQLDPAEPLPPLPLKNLTIRDLNLDRLTLLTPGGDRGLRLAGFSLQASDWQPLADGQWQPLKAVTFSLDADQVGWQGWHLGSLQLEGKSRDGVISVTNSKGRLQGGNMEAVFDWDTNQHALRFSSLMLQNQRLELANAPTLPWQQIDLPKGELNDVTLVGPSGALTANHLTGQLRDIAWQQGQPLEGEFKGTLGELAFGHHSLSDIRTELQLQADNWQGKISGALWEGSLDASGNYQPSSGRLTLDEVKLEKLQAELPANWRDELPTWPQGQLVIRRLDGHHLSLLSYDDGLPLSIKGGELFITDLAISRDDLQPASDKARLEASWGELVYQSLTSRGGELEGELTHQGWQLGKLSLPLDQGNMTASGFWSRDPATPHQLSLNGKDLDPGKLAPFWKPAESLSGNVNLQAELQSRADSPLWWQSLTGTARLDGKDLFIDGIKLDDYLEKSLEAPSHSMTLESLHTALAGGDTAINLLALELKANAGVIGVNGAASTIPHQIALKGQLTLSQQAPFSAQWQSTWGLLDSKGCSALSLSVNGPFLSPGLQQQPTHDCQWQRLGVPYPPQGRQGKLR